MKNLITKEEKCMLWKDELGDTFLLLKYAEVYRYSENTLRLLIFNSAKPSQMRKMGLIFNVNRTDDPLHHADAKVSNLDQIIALGRFKRRPDLKGQWLEDKEKRLAHKIIPYNPKIRG